MARFRPVDTAVLPPFGLSRDQAAQHVGLNSNQFQNLVNQGWMPRPKLCGTRKVWCRDEVEQAFRRLPAQGDPPRKPGEPLYVLDLGEGEGDWQ